MKHFITVLTLIFAYTISSNAATTLNTIKYQGQEREYHLLIPDNIQPNAPLVIVLHGYGGKAEKMLSLLDKQAEEHGFVLCSPQGLKLPNGKTSWNVGYPVQKGCKDDDIGFVCFLAKKLQAKYKLNPRACFLSGMSNGGEMCYLMAMEKPKAFTAYASLAGLTLSCMPRNYSSPVAFMEVHGTEDRVSEWRGDPTNAGGWGEYLSVPLAISHIVSVNDCLSQSIEELPIKRNKVILHRFSDGKELWKDGPRSEVWLYQVIGGDHSWSHNDIDTGDEIWKFFSRFIK